MLTSCLSRWRSRIGDHALSTFWWRWLVTTRQTTPISPVRGQSARGALISPHAHGRLLRMVVAGLIRPGSLLAVVAAFAIVAPVALVAACNIHELGHVAVASLLGWEVERVTLCLPAGGSVEYSHVGVWAGNLQGYAGGFLAAAFLITVYFLVFVKQSRPRQGPGWWGAGLGVVTPLGPQIVNGFVEGMVGPGEDYTVKFAALLPPLVVMALALVVLGYVWTWRSGWNVPSPSRTRNRP